MSQFPPSDPSGAASPGETAMGAGDSSVRRSSRSGLPQPPLMLAPALSATAIALFVVYGLTVISQLLPPRLLLPSWQLQAASALIENGLWPLVGLLLLQLAAYLDPAHRRLQARWQSLGRLGLIAILGFLLLIPVQLVASVQMLHRQDSSQRAQMQRIERNLGQLRQQINAAGSLPDLQQRIRTIQGPDLSLRPEQLRQPMPEIRRVLLANVDQSERQLRARLRAASDQGRRWALLQRNVRGALMALVLAVAYAAATPTGPESQHSQLMRLQHRWRRLRSRLRHRPGTSLSQDDYLRRLSREDGPSDR